MDAKRGLLLGALAVVLSPVALGLAVVMFVLIDEDEADGAEPAGGSLVVGEGGVPPEYAGLIMNAANACDVGLPAPVLAAQLERESNFDPRAQSTDPRTGEPIADGIAQFIPSTWETAGVDGNGDGVRDVWDPEDAIPAQGQMMCDLLRTATEHPEYDGSPIELALAGYNAGWGRVEEFRGVPPESFSGGETYNYVQAIMERSAHFTNLGSSSGWVLPVDGPLGSSYNQAGSMWSSGYHTGIDFTVPTGTPIVSIGPGTVVSAGRAGAYGNEVIIEHTDGMFSQYAHLSALEVAAGDTVGAGDQIGLAGATGNVTGPHLHFEIRTTPDYGTDINPVSYLLGHGLTVL